MQRDDLIAFGLDPLTIRPELIQGRPTNACTVFCTGFREDRLRSAFCFSRGEFTLPTNDVKAAQEAEAAARAASGSAVDPHERADALDVSGRCNSARPASTARARDGAGGAEDRT